MTRGLPNSFSRSGSGFVALRAEDFSSYPVSAFAPFSCSGGWNCFRQYSRGVSAEGLAGPGVARARLTDFANVGVRKTHCDITNEPLGNSLLFVSLTGSP